MEDFHQIIKHAIGEDPVLVRYFKDISQVVCAYIFSSSQNFSMQFINETALFWRHLHVVKIKLF